MEEAYTDSEREQIFAPAPEKISTIIELIRKAQENR